MKSDSLKLDGLKILLFIYPFFIGGYHEFVSCIFSIAFFIYLIVFAGINGVVKLRKNDAAAAILVLISSYLLTTLWAVDKGTAVFGFIKLLPIVPFSVILMQRKEKDEELFSVIPYSGAVMTVLSFALNFVEPLKKFFSVADRLAGFFQYSNVFALFLLIGIAVIFTKEKIHIVDFVLAAVLLFGIFESGSRTVFALTVLTAVILFFKLKNKKIRISIAVLVAAGIAAALIYVLITKDFQTVGRFLTTSVKRSTFIGRLLYYKDALPVILKHPFGLGYLGYYYTQGSFQTGVYSVMFIHNELLQFMLDVGWIPAVLLVIAIIEALFSKNVSFRKKLVLFLICAHSMFDFDLQFTPIMLILLSCLEFTRGKEKAIEFNKAQSLITAGAVCAVCVYFGATTFLHFIHKDALAVKIYPLNTLSQTQLMTDTESTDEAAKYAEAILGHNKKMTTAYSVLAAKSLEEGDVQKYIELENEAVKLNRYNTEEYENYGNTLAIVLEKFKYNLDPQSKEFIEKELRELPKKLDDVKKNTSKLAWMIQDKPELELSEKLSAYINSL